METFNFRFNGNEYPAPLTMQEAIDKARVMAIDNKQITRLEAKDNKGKWVYLGRYIPSPEGFIKYTNPQTRAVSLVPCCDSFPQPISERVVL